MPCKSRLLKILRRSLKILGSILGFMILAGLVITPVLWGKYWDFRVGSVQADTCANCHVMKSYFEDLDSTEQLGGYHTARGVTCTDCHPQSLKSQVRESVAQLLGTYHVPLKRLKYPKAECLQCHEHGSYQEIALRTTDLGISDEKAGGTEANPHQPPHFEELECRSCHRFHQPSTLLCWECHTYEFVIP